MCAPFHPEWQIRPNTRCTNVLPPPFLSLLGQRASWHFCNGRMRATESIFDRLQPRTHLGREIVRVHAACACTWCVEQSVNVGVYAFKSPRFGEIAAANWSRFESYKLSRLPARIRAAPPPSVNTRTARGDWKKGGDGVCVRDWLFGSRQGKILPPNSVCVYCWRIFSPHNLFWRRYCRLRPLSLASIQILGQKYVEDTSPPLWILIYRRTFEKNIFYFRRWNLSRRI